MHFLLVWIKNFDQSPLSIDNVISTEIPLEGAPGTKEQKLHNLVMKHMIHGNSISAVSMTAKLASVAEVTVVKVFFSDHRRRLPSEGGTD